METGNQRLPLKWFFQGQRLLPLLQDLAHSLSSPQRQLCGLQAQIQDDGPRLIAVKVKSTPIPPPPPHTWSDCRRTITPSLGESRK